MNKLIAGLAPVAITSEIQRAVPPTAHGPEQRRTPALDLLGPTPTQGERDIQCNGRIPERSGCPTEIEQPSLNREAPLRAYECQRCTPANLGLVDARETGSAHD